MKKCELLAPAGGPESFIAAAEAGADAIYLGGTAFNARMNAGNFTRDELKEAFGFARLRGIKTYVTMNTLIRDDEMGDALKAAYDMCAMGADALIIQDLGLGSLVRKYIPDIPIHLSTQGSVYSLEGVLAAEGLGYERVVLARELTLEEIRRICAGTKSEIEIFVHGALCICYSGQCQLSRYFGGRSGNRGQCAQPCRLAYDIEEGFEGKTPLGKHILSPKDICLIDRVGELIDAGVASLKIEGRMKSPEYVGTVTSIYRKYMDMYFENGGYTVEEADREALTQIFNRGGFTEGYMDGDPERTLMAEKVPKNAGIYMGTVVKAVKGSPVVSIREDGGRHGLGSISMGDRIEIRGDKNVSALVTYLKPGTKGTMDVGDVKSPVRAGDGVYRITSAKQTERAAVFYRDKTFTRGKYLRKRILNASVNTGGDGSLTVTLTEPERGISVSAVLGAGEEARGSAAAAARIEKSLRKTGGTPFEIGEIVFDGTVDRMVPVSEVNGLRRELLGEMEEALKRSGRKPQGIPAVALTPEEEKSGAVLEVFFYDVEDCERLSAGLKDTGVRTRCLLPLTEMMRGKAAAETAESGFDTVPYITGISKGPEDDFIEKNFADAVRIAGVNGIYVGNLRWLKAFADAGVRVYADAGLNIYNGFTAEALKELGAARCFPSAEAFGEDEGNYPLMVSEHRFGRGMVRDRKGEVLRFRESPFGGKSLITPEKPVDIYAAARRAREEKRTIRIYI